MGKGVLMIAFHGDEIEKLEKWKKIVLGMEGHGGIKKRILGMIEEDIKNANRGNLSGASSKNN